MVSKSLEQTHIIFAALAAGGEEATLNPEHIQNLLFMIHQQLSNQIDSSHFAIEPGPFGPFDRKDNDVFPKMCHEGLFQTLAAETCSHYALTARGLAQGLDVLTDFEALLTTKLCELFALFRTFNFRQPLAVLQTRFPDMVGNRKGGAGNQPRSESARRPLVIDCANETSSHSF